MDKNTVMDTSGLLGSFLPIILLIVVFYFLLILPQQKQAKKRAAMLDALKTGDRIETVSRVFGEVVEVIGDRLTIRIGTCGDDTKIQIHREGVARVLKLDDPQEKKISGI